MVPWLWHMLLGARKSALGVLCSRELGGTLCDLFSLQTSVFTLASASYRSPWTEGVIAQ